MDYQTILLGIDIWREDRGGTHASRVAMGWVVKNRVAHPGWWGDTIVQVITHKFQFSSMTAPGDPNLVEWPQENDPTPETDPVWADCLQAAQEVIAGTNDPTKGAVYYYSEPIISPPEEWGKVVQTVQIDGVTFCKGAA